jgi:hypothetical protein
MQNQNKDTILAKGHVKESFAKVIVIGSVLIILSLGGVAATIYRPDSSKDLWMIISPIISATLGFLAGRHVPAREK